jgi:hypothetical protein
MYESEEPFGGYTGVKWRSSMSDAIVGGLIGVGSIILGFALNSGWEWWRYKRQVQREREGFRTLLSVEILQNLTALLLLRGALESALEYGDSRNVAYVFSVTAVMPEWQTTRWEMPEAGKCLDSSELMRIGEWYIKLGGINLLYQRLMEQVRQVKWENGALSIDRQAGDAAAEQIRGILENAKTLQDSPPPLPDADLDKGESIGAYLKDLEQRTLKEAGGIDTTAS